MWSRSGHFVRVAYRFWCRYGRFATVREQVIRTRCQARGDVVRVCFLDALLMLDSGGTGGPDSDKGPVLPAVNASVALCLCLAAGLLPQRWPPDAAGTASRSHRCPWRRPGNSNGGPTLLLPGDTGRAAGPGGGRRAGLAGAAAEAVGVDDEDRLGGELDPASGGEVGQCLVDRLPRGSDELGQLLLGQGVAGVDAGFRSER